VRTRIHDIEVEDTAIAALESDGSPGHDRGGHSCFPGSNLRLESRANAAPGPVSKRPVVRGEFADTKPGDAAIRAADATIWGRAQDPMAISNGWPSPARWDLVDAITRGRAPAVPAREPATRQLIEAIYLSAEPGAS